MAQRVDGVLRLQVAPAHLTIRVRSLVVSRRGYLLLVSGLLLLAFNLRPAVVSIGPLLDEIRDGTAMSATTAGFLTTLPVLCFAVFGASAPWCARRFGMHAVLLVCLLLTAVGLSLRAAASSSALFLVATVPALAGVATANVLIPSLVKRHFPDRLGSMTAVYTTVLALGLTAGSVLTVPLADAIGSWRGGLATWAVVALAAATPWLFLVRHDIRPPDDAAVHVRTSSLRHSPLAVAMAIFFGLQSIQAYAAFGWLPQIFRDAGFSATRAGLLLGLTTAISIPLSLVLPGLAARRRHQSAIIVSLCASYAVGYLGLVLGPRQAPWLWAALIGVGSSIFPLALTLISLRARTSGGTAALSGFAQSLGYLLAGLGPLMMGVLYGATGRWTVPLIVLTVLLLPQAITGILVSRDRFVEDELAHSPGR